jgi:DNA-binding winged helix-turn-helix (wHTH) protein
MTDLTPSRLRFGPFEVDLAARELSKSGIRVKLSGQPFEILAALLEHPGQLVTRESLRKRIWSEDTFVDFGHGLNAAVNKLREALCDSANDPRYIETLPRRGYRFIAAVEKVKPATVPVPVVSQPVVAPPAWKNPSPLTPLAPLVNEKWEETVPVKRQTLVQASATLGLALLLAVGIAHYWFDWPGLPSGQAIEQHLKQSGPESDPQTMESRAKQFTVIPAQIGKRSAKQPASDDSFIQRLEGSGGQLGIFEGGEVSETPAILRFDLARANKVNSVTRVVDGHDAIAGPQPSPDGKKLVFTAGRIDAMEVWVCNADGSAPHALTNMGRTGTPRWSPDGRWIAFDSDGRVGNSGIYVVSVNGGPVRHLVEDTSNNSVPSWSRDGKYVYFASNRSGGWGADQVWKVPAEGGEPVRITRQGGFSAFESPDGQTLYYAKSRYENPEIWQVPVNGGTESPVSLLHPSTWASWAMTKTGILLLSEYSRQSSELQYFDFATRSIHPLVTLEKASFWLASSANGSSIWYSELTDHQAREVFKAGLN